MYHLHMANVALGKPKEEKSERKSSFMVKTSQDGKARYFCAPNQAELERWTANLESRIRDAESTSEAQPQQQDDVQKKNVIFSVSLSQVVYRRKDQFWRISGKGAKGGNAGALQFLEEITGFLLSTGV